MFRSGSVKISLLGVRMRVYANEGRLHGFDRFLVGKLGLKGAAAGMRCYFAAKLLHFYSDIQKRFNTDFKGTLKITCCVQRR